jgi:arylsulfatase A-like enzyme
MDAFMRLVAAALVILAFATPTIVQAQARPNILLIITDQQSADAMSCRMGREHIHTPAMDSLAAGGMLFTNTYAPNPLCMPARNSLFTGRYPHETGVTRNSASTSRMNSKEFVCMGNLFRAAGYQTAYFGKWHLAYNAKNIESHGFETISISPKPGHDEIATKAATEFIARKHDKPFLLVVNFMNPHNICEYARGQDLPDGPIAEPPPPTWLPKSTSRTR